MPLKFGGGVVRGRVTSGLGGAAVGHGVTVGVGVGVVGTSEGEAVILIFPPSVQSNSCQKTRCIQYFIN